MSATRKHNIYLTINGTDASYAAKHNQAIRVGTHREHAITSLFTSLQRYAQGHFERYQTEIGHDYVLGPAWKSMCAGLLTLLNGDCGRLDCGTIDAAIRDLAALHCVDLEG